MKKGQGHKKHRSLYLVMSVGEKGNLQLLVMFLSILIIAVISLYFIRLSSKETGQILTQISRCERVQDKLGKEESALKAYLTETTEANEKALQKACTATKAAVDELPYDVTDIGAERYARTWNLKNAYETYAGQRDEVLTDGSPISRQYDLLGLFDYLDTYARNLTQLTVEAGGSRYDTISPFLQSLPYLVCLISAVLLLAASSISRSVTKTIVGPVDLLVKDARRMAEGDYSGGDVVVENEDEIGELVRTFNRMKKATKDNIETLEEKQKLEAALREEEAQKAELTHRLETTRLDLLKSQINPHFLFNTLGTIASMAELEDAATTGKMILSLSNIFRYNLRASDSFTSLTAEIQNAKDYLYLQKMRFGDRVLYEFHLGEGVNPDRIEVPVFLLQPVIENALSHGIAKKAEGGRIDINATLEDGALHLSVKDTGVGIPREKLDRILEELHSGHTGHEVHIGVGNIYRRIQQLYENGSMTIESTENVGTTVTMVIPQGGKEIHGRKENNTDRG